jgi:regulator of nucleoside diphosphate kinase
MVMYFDRQVRFDLPEVIFHEDDYDRLLDLVCASPRATPGIALLWQELQRGERVPDLKGRRDVARLGSLVTFTDLMTGQRRAAQLVAPGAGRERRRLCVTTPDGAALIGLRPGDTFTWSLDRNAAGALRIDDVTDDPRRKLRRAEAKAATRRARVRELLSLS